MAKAKLKPQIAEFAKVYASTGDAQAAAMRAGYTNPRHGYNLANRADVLGEVKKFEHQRLVREALPAAVACLIEILNDPNQRGSTRVAAAKVVMDRTLGEKGGADGKEAHELTGEELARAIEELEREASARARPVNPGVFD